MIISLFPTFIPELAPYSVEVLESTDVAESTMVHSRDLGLAYLQPQTQDPWIDCICQVAAQFGQHQDLLLTFHTELIRSKKV